ncbi:MAG: UDP-3-O-acyl-N-acetylglucosamine deacetylase [Thermoanaerobaculia bacterium]
MSTLVMIVDDEPGILTSLSAVLADEGYETVCADSGERAVELYRERSPAVVLLDIWLPDRDGLETLQALRAEDPGAAVVMMSGHGTAATAVKAIKLGAVDYVEKPLSYSQAVSAVEAALEFRRALESDPTLRAAVGPVAAPSEAHRRLEPPPRLPIVRQGSEPQRTLRSSMVLYGLGLHSGTRTGMALQPLPPDTGIHFVTLPSNTFIPGHVDSVAETDYATTLSKQGASIKTVEHLLSALHARGITNLLVKVHGEIPVLDGSALEFCQALDDIGVEEQGAPRWELVIDREYSVEGDGGKRLSIEPCDGFEVSYHLSYPPPVGDQEFSFRLDGWQGYREQVAPARTFGFLKDLKMMNELGLATGGRLDNCILVAEDGVVNTELRFPDEFARHKVLDIVGDLYLLGFPIRGRVHGHVTGHRMNIALLREIQRRAGTG